MKTKYMHMKIIRKIFVVLFVALLVAQTATAEDGYDLWLRYKAINDTEVQNLLKKQFATVYVAGNSQTAHIIKKELTRAMQGMLSFDIEFVDEVQKSSLVIGTPANSTAIANLSLIEKLEALSNDGYVINNKISGETISYILYQKPMLEPCMQRFIY
jgi:alpha-glucuronidase